MMLKISNTVSLKTPYYLIDKAKLLKNMEKIAYVREHSGAKSLLALKCFATWSVFDLMSEYMDGMYTENAGAVFGHSPSNYATHSEFRGFPR